MTDGKSLLVCSAMLLEDFSSGNTRGNDLGFGVQCQQDNVCKNRVQRGWCGCERGSQRQRKRIAGKQKETHRLRELKLAGGKD